MAKMPVVAVETDEPVGEIEIPDDVIEAAARVENWMRSQPHGEAIRLHGLMLSDD